MPQQVVVKNYPSEWSREILDLVDAGQIVILRGAARDLVEDVSRTVSSFASEATGKNLQFDSTGLKSIHDQVSFEKIQRIVAAVKGSGAEKSRYIQDFFRKLFELIDSHKDFLIESTIHFRIRTPDWFVPDDRPITDKVPSPPHCDFWYDLPLNSLNFWVSVTDSSKENGVTIYPERFERSVDYFFDTQQNAEAPVPGQNLGEAVTFELAAGDVLIFAGRHLHATLPNVSDMCRVSMDYRIVHRDRVLPCSTLLNYRFINSSGYWIQNEFLKQVIASLIFLRYGKFAVAISCFPINHHRIRAYVGSLSKKTKYFLSRIKHKGLEKLNTEKFLKWVKKSFLGKLIRRIHSYTAFIAETETIAQGVFRKSIQVIDSHSTYWKQFGSKYGEHTHNYLEFGVQDGESMIQLWNILCANNKGKSPNNWHLYGFDSFQGLPDFQDGADIHPIVGKGAYASRGKEFVEGRLLSAGIPRDRFTLIEGFYEDVLNDDLKEKLGIRTASFVNIDCDYYSSTMVALEWSKNLLFDGAIVHFDDVGFYNYNPNKGELKAIRDFNQRHEDMGLSCLYQVDIGGKVYGFWRSLNDENQSEKLSFYGDPTARGLNSSEKPGIH